MNTKIINILHNKIKVFRLVKFKDRIYQGRNEFLEIDEKEVAICFGIIIDDYAISIGNNVIYPIYDSSPSTELNQYYIYDIHDYGKPIPFEHNSVLYEEDDDKLLAAYNKTIEWYNETKEREKENIVYFQKIKSKY